MSLIPETAPPTFNNKRASLLEKFSWSTQLEDSTSSTEEMSQDNDPFEQEWALYQQKLKSTRECNSIKFWLDNSAQLPILSDLALSIFTVPASSSAVERLFSQVTMNTASRKANSKIDLVNQNVFMAFNRDFIDL